MNKAELEKALSGRPMDICAALSVRATLRATPLLAAVFEADLPRNTQNGVVLSGFRTVLSAAAATVFPEYRPALVISTSRRNRAISEGVDSLRPVAILLSASRTSLTTLHEPPEMTAADEGHAAGAAGRAISRAESALGSQFGDLHLPAFWDAFRQDLRTVEFQAAARLFDAPLWGDAVPDEIDRLESNAWGWLNDPHWAFWRRWFRGMRAGQPVPWHLQGQIARIPESDWAKGPEHVATLIAAMEATEPGSPLDQHALRAHLAAHVGSFDLFADAASGVADQVSLAVHRFKQEAPANALPEGFAAFELLPDAYRALAQTFSGGAAADLDALAAQNARLHEIIAQLRRELGDARRQLAEARLSRVEAAQMRTFGEKLTTTLTNITLIGAIGMSAASFFGVTASDLNYEALRDALRTLGEDMQNIEPREPPDALPQVRET